MPLSKMTKEDLCNLIDTLRLPVSRAVGGLKRRTKQQMANEIMEQITDMIADGRAKVVLTDTPSEKANVFVNVASNSSHVNVSCSSLVDSFLSP